MKIPEDLKVGTVFSTNNFGKLIIISYTGYKKIGIRFFNTGHERFAVAGDIRRGEVCDTGLKVSVGDIVNSNHSGAAIVIQVVNNKAVTVKFEKTGYELTTEFKNFKSGNFKDPYHPRICSVGYVGVPAGLQSVASTKSYDVWKEMLSRCYEPEATHFPVYGGVGVRVCEDWHNYQNFREFYDTDLYRQKGWQIDKDIMIRGNTVYSSENCAFVPREVNMAIVKAKLSTYPQGVDFHKASGKFRSRISVYGKTINLYSGDCFIDAFNKYKTAKECYLKDLAKKWTGLVNPRVTESLNNWEILLTDYV